MTATGCSSTLVPDTDDVLRALVTYAIESGSLEAEAPWSLAPREAARLRDYAGFAPAGGWHGVVGLAAGVGLLKAHHGCFVPMAINFAGDAEGARQLLLSAFTERLCPPAALASMLVALGVSPLYGLGVAARVRSTSSPVLKGGALSGAALVAVEAAIFNAIRDFESGLSALAPRRVDFEDIVDLATRGMKRHRPSDLAVVETQLQPVVQGELSGLMMRMVADDLLTHAFVPAGLVRRHNDTSVTVPSAWV